MSLQSEEAVVVKEKSMIIVGLDLASKCGWAVWKDERLVASGTIDLGKEERVLNFYSHLQKLEHKYDTPDHFVYELPGVLHGHAKKVLVSLKKEGRGRQKQPE